MRNCLSELSWIIVYKNLSLKMVCESCPKRMTCLRNDHICVTTACSCRVIGCWPSAASSGRLSQSLPLTAPIINAFQTRRHGGVGGVEGAQAAVHGPPAPKGRGALDTAESGREEVWAASGGGRTDARPAPWRRRIPNCHACRLVSGVDQLQRGMGGGSHLKHSVCTAECMPEGLCRRRPDPPDKPAHLPGCLAAVTPPPMGLHRRGGSKLGDLRAFRATTPPPSLILCCPPAASVTSAEAASGAVRAAAAAGAVCRSPPPPDGAGGLVGDQRGGWACACVPAPRGRGNRELRLRASADASLPGPPASSAAGRWGRWQAACRIRRGSAAVQGWPCCAPSSSPPRPLSASLLPAPLSRAATAAVSLAAEPSLRVRMGRPGRHPARA